MKHTFTGPLPDHARNLLRRAGYGEQRTRSGQISFVRRVSGERFPRYHAYVEDTPGGGMQVNLHVDQKEATYEGSSAHSGEYEGPVVEREMERIVQVVSSLNTTTQTPTQPQPKKKTGFLSKFF
jgi:hypothetical protein